jgi:hypothetical protein
LSMAEPLSIWVLVTIHTAEMIAGGQLLDGSRRTFRLDFTVPLLGLRL